MKLIQANMRILADLVVFYRLNEDHYLY